MAYGKTTENNYLQGGINENVFLTKFTQTSVSTANYEGKVIDVEISNGSSSVSKRLFPITAPVNPTSDEQKAYDRRTSEQTTWLKKVIINYCTEEAWDKAMESVQDFDTLFTACKNLLPPNFDKIPARVVLTYVEKRINNEVKYYLEIPNVSWLNKPWTFFTTNASEKLGVSDKIVTTRPNFEATVAEQAPVASDEDPF